MFCELGNHCSKAEIILEKQFFNRDMSMLWMDERLSMSKTFCEPRSDFFWVDKDQLHPELLLGYFVSLIKGRMLKAPPLKSSVLHFSVLNSKTEVFSNGGIQKKFDKLTLQHRHDKIKIL